MSRAGGTTSSCAARGAGGEGGELVTTDGAVVGEHAGIEGFTVGQRKGLGVALGDRKFVVRIEAESRRVVIGDRTDLNRKELTAANCNWMAFDPAAMINQPQPCFAQIRYNAAGTACHDDGAAGTTFASCF